MVMSMVYRWPASHNLGGVRAMVMGMATGGLRVNPAVRSSIRHEVRTAVPVRVRVGPEQRLGSG